MKSGTCSRVVQPSVSSSLSACSQHQNCQSSHRAYVNFHSAQVCTLRQVQHLQLTSASNADNIATLTNISAQYQTFQFGCCTSASNLGDVRTASEFYLLQFCHSTYNQVSGGTEITYFATINRSSDVFMRRLRSIAIAVSLLPCSAKVCDDANLYGCNVHLDVSALV
jgi:hypothetical protein